MARKRELGDYFELQEGVEMQKSAHPLESLLQFIQGGTFDPNQQAQPGELPSRYLDKVAHVLLPDFIKNILPWMNPPSAPQVEWIPESRLPDPASASEQLRLKTYEHGGKVTDLLALKDRMSGQINMENAHSRIDSLMADNENKDFFDLINSLTPQPNIHRGIPGTRPSDVSSQDWMKMMWGDMAPRDMAPIPTTPLEDPLSRAVPMGLKTSSPKEREIKSIIGEYIEKELFSK